MLNIVIRRAEEPFKAVKLVIPSVVNGFNDARAFEIYGGLLQES